MSKINTQKIISKNNNFDLIGVIKANPINYILTILIASHTYIILTLLSNRPLRFINLMVASLLAVVFYTIFKYFDFKKEQKDLRN